MRKDELIEEAKKLGLRVRGSYMDDVLENSLISVAFFVFGWFSHALYALFS